MSKHNIKSVVEINQSDIDIELDNEYKQDMINEIKHFDKEYDLNSKCINIMADIRTYLDGNSVSDEICTGLDVDGIKQLLFEIYS